MKKRIKIDCPECGNKIERFGISSLPQGFGDKVHAVDCLKCGWTQAISLDDLRIALENPKPPKGMFKAYWEGEEP